jgi:tRNA threonylcarbamoyladenosine biosynthesis protein TsaE
MLQFSTNGPEATLMFGKKLAARLQAGDVVCLSGDLGAGKTLLVQGIAAGMGITGDVTSPTFTILQVYDNGQMPFYHFDLYRLDTFAELENIGFEEYVGTDGVTVIEWADKFVEAMPESCLWIKINLGKEETERIIYVKPEGERFGRLCEELR